MCSIFGLSVNDMELLRKLGINGEFRGTDATGVGTVRDNGFDILKDNRRASVFEWEKVNMEGKFFVGHTRMTTQGSEIDNFNNHPFISENKDFILTHNGMITNDYDLSLKYDLPDTKIKTDSYVIVQMIELIKNAEGESEINLEILKTVCELIDGNYALAISTTSKLYLLSYFNPINLLYNGESLMYASTSYMLEDIANKCPEYGVITELSQEVIYEFDYEKNKFVNSIEFNGFKSYNSYSYSNEGDDKPFGIDEENNKKENYYEDDLKYFDEEKPIIETEVSKEEWEEMKDWINQRKEKIYKE